MSELFYDRYSNKLNNNSLDLFATRQYNIMLVLRFCEDTILLSKKQVTKVFITSISLNYICYNGSLSSVFWYTIIINKCFKFIDIFQFFYSWTEKDYFCLSVLKHFWSSFFFLLERAGEGTTRIAFWTSQIIYYISLAHWSQTDYFWQTIEHITAPFSRSIIPFTSCLHFVLAWSYIFWISLCTFFNLMFQWYIIM